MRHCVVRFVIVYFILLLWYSFIMQTIDLLYKMTNPYNVEVVTQKMLAFLEKSVDVHLRTELVSRITQNAERYVNI